MDEQKFGDILFDRRRKLGLSIDQAVAATKLRAQVLEAFENADFENMPPKGYAQGMISSYARFLELDPRMVLNHYFDDLYEFESQVEYDAPEPLRRYESPHEVSTRRPSTSDRTSRTGSGYGEPRGGVYANDPYGANDAYGQSNRGGGGYTPRGGAPRGYGSQGGGDDRKRLYIKIGVIAAIVLVIIVIAWALISTANNSDDELATIPVTSSTSTETSTSAETSASAETSTSTEASTTTSTEASTTQDGTTDTTTTSGEPFTISFTVAEGSTSWIQVTVDGKTAYAATAVGPTTEEFDVTESIQIEIGAPDGVTVEQDGEEIDIPTSNGVGVIDLSVE